MKKLLLITAAMLALSACNDRAKMCSDMVSKGFTDHTAFEHCKSAAESGNAEAQYYYAKLLEEDGQTEEAKAFLEKSAAQNNPKALAKLESSRQDAISAEQAQRDEEHRQKSAQLERERAEFEAKKAKEEAKLEQQRQELEAMYEGDGEECIDDFDRSKLKFNEKMAYFKDGCSERYGFVNEEGDIVIPAKYKNAGGFYNGRAVVQNDDELWGYIDKQGNWIVKPQFCMAGRFSEGLAGVYVGGYRSGNECYGGKWGFITPSGKMAIEPNYDRAWAFSRANGQVKAKVEYGNYTVYINGKGEWVD